MVYRMISDILYVTEDNRVIIRKPIIGDEFKHTPDGNWLLINTNGIVIDSDKYLNDLTERNGLKEEVDIGDGEGEPKPAKNADLRLAGHHWLDCYDIDGHFHQRVVLQWNPSAKRWSHSGDVGTGIYVNTQYWRYVAPCPIPE